MKIKINDKYYLYFNNVSIGLTLDSTASVFSFNVYFDPKNEDHKIIFKPLSYPKLEIFNDAERLILTGVIIRHDFNSDKTPGLVKLTGYSKGGVLDDANIPYNAYPLESIRRSLKDIAENLLQLFDLKLIVDASVTKEASKQFAKSVASPEETITGYLAKLAAQRNVLLSHNEFGDIVLFRPDITKPPKYHFTKENTLICTSSIGGQQMHDEISVIRQPSKDNNNLSTQESVKNNLLNSFRPKVKVLNSGSDTDTSTAVKNAFANELKNISITIILEQWLDLDRGDIVEVTNDEVFLFKRTKLLILSIRLDRDNGKDKMTIKLVLPETFTGTQPKNIFE